MKDVVKRCVLGGL